MLAQLDRSTASNFSTGYVATRMYRVCTARILSCTGRMHEQARHGLRCYTVLAS